ncbi:lytic transglycosylase domain-containing protein [Nocardioides panaciterrulae]|uniref:Lytic transglycosylase domain-containing protein n=1 Tax=Nocardioides panaciterrulae TaxID=661492 RepID=A0A7Y9JC15_9ACTN|nr:lytic transglycosylase domain-containing protein [Nocardioides panaciterrulae]NYD42938.1 hypothetical protein [Nocardioides panaciterrulae]
MPKRAKYAPKHRQLPTPNVVTEAPKRALRNTLILSSVAVAATGAAVSAGTFSSSPATVTNAAQDLGQDYHPATTQDLSDRAPVISRSSDRRQAADPAKQAELAAEKSPAVTHHHHETLASQDPRDIAKALMPQFGFSSDQYGCLDQLWTGESGWRVDADNPTSSAYGIPQALPGSKMASAGPDWATNAATQIKWGLGYIRDSYGSPCGAMAFKNGHGWY